jgi:hypothetical protein
MRLLALTGFQRKFPGKRRSKPIVLAEIPA